MSLLMKPNAIKPGPAMNVTASVVIGKRLLAALCARPRLAANLIPLPLAAHAVMAHVAVEKLALPASAIAASVSEVNFAKVAAPLAPIKIPNIAVKLLIAIG